MPPLARIRRRGQCNRHHVSAFRIDGSGALTPQTAEPTPIDHTETRGIHCRTCHIDPSGRRLVAAHLRPVFVREGSDVRQISACLSMFRIGSDGKLAFVRKYDIDVGSHTLFWMGMVPP